MFGEVVGTARVKIDVDTSTVDRDIERSGKRSAQLFQNALLGVSATAAGAAAAVAPLISQAVALSGSLVSAASASGTLVPVLTSLGQGAAALAVGFSGFGEAIEDGGEELADLSPAAREAAVTIRGLGDEWDSLTRTVQQELFSGVAGDIDRLAGSLLPSLEARLTDTASSFNRLASEIADTFTTPARVEDFNRVLSEQNSIIDGLARSVVPLGEGMLDLFLPVLPFARSLAEQMPGIADGFARWAASARESGAVTDFFERAVMNAGNLLSAVRDLTVGIGNMFSLGQVEGDSLLGTIAELSARFREFTESAEGQAELGAWFEAGARYADQFADGLRIVADVARVALAVLEPIGDVVGPAISALVGPVDALADVFTALPDPVMATAAALLLLRNSRVSGAIEGITGAARRLGDQMAVQRQLAAQAGQSISTMGAAAATAQTRFSGLSASVRGLGAAVAAGAAFSALSNVLGSSADEMRRFVESTEGLGGGTLDSRIGALRDRIAELDAGLADVADTNLGVTRVWWTWDRSVIESARQSDALKERLAELEHQQGLNADRQAQLSAAGIDTAESLAVQAEAAGVLPEVYEQAQTAFDGLATSITEALVGFTEPVALFEGANRRAAEAAAVAAGESADSWADFSDSATASMADFLAELDAQISAQVNFASNLATIAARGGEAMAQSLLEAGPKMADAAALLASATDAEFTEAAAKWPRTTAEGMAATSAEMARWIPIAAQVATQYGADVAANIGAAIAAGETTVAAAMAGLGATVTENVPGDVVIPTRLDPAQFYAGLGQVNASIGVLAAQTPTPTANLNDAPLMGRLVVDHANLVELDAQRPTPTADLDDRFLISGVTTGNALVDELNRKHAEPTAGLDYLDVTRGVGSAQSIIDGLRGKTVEAGASVYGAGDVSWLKRLIDSLYNKTVTVTTVYKNVGGPIPKGGALGSMSSAPGGGGNVPAFTVPLTSREDARALGSQSWGAGSAGYGAAGRDGSGGGRSIVIEAGAIQVITPAKDPAIVAEMVMDELAGLVR